MHGVMKTEFGISLMDQARIKMDCEMCGKDEAALKAVIEGTIITVCENCSRFGKVVGKISVPAAAVKGKAGKERMPAGEDYIEMVVPEFGCMIKQKRESLGLKQDEFARKVAVKESVLHKMETGSLKPSLEEARRLGKALGLKLVEKLEEGPAVATPQRKDMLTLGDMIKIKKR